MGDDIKTGRITGSYYWAALHWLSESENGHRPELMSSLSLAASSTYMFDFALDTSFMDFIFIFLG